MNMTNREDILYVPGGGAYFLSKSRLTTHTLHNHQVKEESPHKQSSRIASPKKAGQVARASKPSIELYRPPTRNNQKNGAKVHFQIDTGVRDTTTPAAELKSALKRSKSFASGDLRDVSTGFERDAFPIEYQGLIRNAMLDPNLLSSRELMELVRILCSKAVESVQKAQTAAHTCFAIIEKETAGTFIESLLNACREWFNERDKLLRSPFPSASSGVHPTGGSGRWTAYVSFLTELYLRIKSQHRQSVISNSQKALSNSSGNISPVPSATHHTLSLLTLLYQCLLIILKPPALNNLVEVECLRSTLVTIGKQLEKDAPLQMHQVAVYMRDAFVNPSVTAQIRKTILELIELRASNWQLALPQLMYYFPYTSVEKR